ncbi:MAG: serine hydrolase [Oscillibacter sp.]|nr:serine hydrolase [Oscillibacter sp.]
MAMLERILGGIMALWVAIMPGAAEGAQPESAPEPTAAVVQQVEQADAPSLTLESVRGAAFSDSPSDAADAISYAAYFGLMSGYEDGTFRPDGFLSAGQAVRILRRIAKHTGLDAGAETQSDSDWAEAVELLTAEGGGFRLTYRPQSELLITEGDFRLEYRPQEGQEALAEDTEASVFVRPEAELTRAQLALLLYRFAAFAGYDLSCAGDLSLRPDAPRVPGYAKIPCSWAMEHNIYRTIVADGLCPGLPVSRAQAALIFTALLADGTGEPVAAEITQAAQQPFFISKSRNFHDSIQDAVDAAGRRYGATGIQVAVVERGRLADTFAYGWAVRNSERMTAAHKIRIASISKVLIGMAAARMRQDGLVDYDEPLGTYWDATFRNPAHPDSPVTIKTLLTHTSSLSDGALTGSAVRSRLASGRGYTSAVPGSLDGWEYSNYGFGVLGMTLERAAGRTMDELLDRYFFDLMGIDASFYAGDLRDNSELAELYRDGSATLSLSAQRARRGDGVPGSDGSVFAGGLNISGRDLGKVAALLANDGVYEGLRLLDADSVRLMETYENQKTPDGFYQAMPLRYHADAYGRNGIYYHTGSAYGVFNGFSYDPETGDGVVVLTVGASGARDANGNYAICGAIFDAAYHTLAS